MTASEVAGRRPSPRDLFRPLGRAAALWILVATVIGVGATPAVSLQLVTEEESRLPDGATAPRGVLRGPTISIVTPASAAGMIRSPFRLKVSFRSHGGAEVVPDSILVTYEKVPPIDLTQRLQPYIEAAGIDVSGAIVPPGEHRLRIDAADTLGHSSSAWFTIRVSP